MRMAGRMGGERVTVKNLQVVKVVEADNLIYLKGAVPGARNSYVALREAKRG
jgi:large subunit ribosomal protein L3